MHKPYILTLSILSLLLILVSCSEESSPTGGSVTGNPNDVSTLVITVQDEFGRLLDGADIYVNDIFKGKTNKYGSSKGTRTVVLADDENSIRIEKEGYATSSETSLYAKPGQAQAVTIRLERKKTEYRLLVRDDDGNEVEDAKVLLFFEKSTTPLESTFTDQNGVASFEKLSDGSYTVRINHDQYEKAMLQEEINFAKNGKLKIDSVTLRKLPLLSIKVVDVDDEPIDGVAAALYTKESYNSLDAVPQITQMTNYAGKTEFKNVEFNQKYVVVLKKHNYLAQTIEKTLRKEDQSINTVMVWNID